MNLDTAIHLVETNANFEGESMCANLRQQRFFDEKGYWNFYNAVRRLAFAHGKGIEVEHVVLAQVVRVYGFFLSRIATHFDPNEQYTIDELPKRIAAYPERWRFAVDALFDRNPISDKREIALDMDLRNWVPSYMDGF